MFVPAWKSTPTANKVPLMGIRVSAWSLGSREIPRIPSWKEYIRKELRPVMDNSKREMLDGGQTNVTQVSLCNSHITKQAAKPKTTWIAVRSEEKYVTSLPNTKTQAMTAAYLHRRAGHCEGCSQWCRHMCVCFQMWADRAASNRHYSTDRHSYLRENTIRRENTLMDEKSVLRTACGGNCWL